MRRAPGWPMGGPDPKKWVGPVTAVDPGYENSEDKPITGSERVKFKLKDAFRVAVGVAPP